jgi:HPt (histidine-containing phosphotransfer) domain-containing protein
LQQALQVRALTQVRDAAHALKSACSTVGAAGLAALCERLEQAANRQDWHDIDACVVALPECSRELRERLGNYQ